MQEFWFYIKLGFNHVMDPGAHDHILFLCALVIPFTFRNWKKVVLLATVFTVMHCFSLALSVYNIWRMDIEITEFLIPLTIALTGLFNIAALKWKTAYLGLKLHLMATAFFGLIHGFGFSNYFNMLMAEEDEKMTPLFGFAAGIEISQLLILIAVLGLAQLAQSVLKISQTRFIVVTSIIIVLLTIPMLAAAVP